MSVRVVRMRNGEDVICDLYEVTMKDGEEAFAFQLRNPYLVYLTQGMDAEADGEIHKISDPSLGLEPWMPLLKGDSIMVKMDEIVSAYETHDQIVDKYNEIIGAKEHVESAATEERESD